MISRRVILDRNFWRAIVLALTATACSFGGPLREDVKASSYSLGKTPRSWIQETASDSKGRDTSGADYIFKDRVTKSMIAVNSVCFRYESTSLERLAHQFENGLKNTETLSEAEFNIDGRTGDRLHLRGDFDGVPSEVLVVVLRKNDCLFDFSLVGVSPLKEELIRDFDQWVQGFHYGVAGEKRPD